MKALIYFHIFMCSLSHLIVYLHVCACMYLNLFVYVYMYVYIFVFAKARREKKELERQKELAAARSKLLSQGDVRDAMKRQEALQMQMQAAYRIGDRATVAKIERMLKPDEPK